GRRERGVGVAVLAVEACRQAVFLRVHLDLDQGPFRRVEVFFRLGVQRRGDRQASCQEQPRHQGEPDRSYSIDGHDLLWVLEGGPVAHPSTLRNPHAAAERTADPTDFWKSRAPPPPPPSPPPVGSTAATGVFS